MGIRLAGTPLEGILLEGRPLAGTPNERKAPKGTHPERIPPEGIPLETPFERTHFRKHLLHTLLFDKNL